MHCPGCEYPLWNLKDRRCPECGKDFLPSQFKFVPRSVRFLCPHCNQQYFGTGVDGHLVPRSFTCITCGHGVDMDEMVLLPAEGLESEHTRVGVNPWIDRQRRGLLGRYFATVGKSLSGPTALIESTPVSSSAWRAMFFAAINLLAGPLLGVVTLLLLYGAFGALGTRGGGPGAVVFLGFAPLFAFAVVFMLVWLAGWAIFTHVLLMITGPTAGGFRRTIHCLCYSSSPGLLVSVPCLGGYLFPVAVVWQMIVASIMVHKGQRISGLRATFAVILPPLVAGALIIAGLVWAFSAAMTAAASAGATLSTQMNLPVTMQSMRVQAMASALSSAAASSGRYPDHAVDLLINGSLTSGDFSLSSDPLASDSIIVGSTTLGRLSSLTPSAREAMIQKIVASQPGDVVAHRVGDFVFTYHGLTPASGTGLWLFIAESPRGAPNQSPSNTTFGMVAQATDTFFVCQVDGTLNAVPRAIFGSLLEAQNNLRAMHGLDPIPDLSTITASSPATKPK
ncbi:MAG: YIP1 family protein [Phycisphaeraceae bacterium]|nr:YIP1 family protein [Phycisphaeraceae bacterium]